MWRAGYRLLLWLAFPFVLARLWWRGRHERGYRQNVGERFGFYRAKPERRVIFPPAASVGETRAADPLLDALPSHHPDSPFFITPLTATRRGAAPPPSRGGAAVSGLPYR